MIDDDGEAVSVSWGQNDLTFDTSAVVVHELQLAATYELCLNDPSAEARLGCALTLGPELETCRNGSSSDDW